MYLPVYKWPKCQTHNFRGEFNFQLSFYGFICYLCVSFMACLLASRRRWFMGLRGSNISYLSISVILASSTLWLLSSNFSWWLNLQQNGYPIIFKWLHNNMPDMQSASQTVIAASTQCSMKYIHTLNHYKCLLNTRWQQQISLTVHFTHSD